MLSLLNKALTYGHKNSIQDFHEYVSLSTCVLEVLLGSKKLGVMRNLATQTSKDHE